MVMKLIGWSIRFCKWLNEIKLVLRIEKHNHRYRFKLKATKLQDQDHLFFQAKTGLAKTKTKTAFFKDHQIINPRPLAQPEILI